MARRGSQMPKWQMEMLETWGAMGFPDHYEHYIATKGPMHGKTLSIDALKEIAQHYREQFYKPPVFRK